MLTRLANRGPFNKLLGDLVGFGNDTDSICFGDRRLGVDRAFPRKVRAGGIRMGPGGTPFFKALPLGVAAGGVRRDCGGRGL